MTHNTSTRLIGAATAKDAWLILFWFLRQFYVIKRQIAAESTFFNFFSIIWKPSQASYTLAATVALCVFNILINYVYYKIHGMIYYFKQCLCLGIWTALFFGTKEGILLKYLDCVHISIFVIYCHLILNAMSKIWNQALHTNIITLFF